MATSFAWPSVLVKRGPQVVRSRTVIKCNWDDSFGSLLEKVDVALAQESVEKVQISKNEQFVDPVHVVPIDSPVSLCKQFDCMFVCIYLTEREMLRQRVTGVNAFEIMMARSRELVLPKTMPGENLRGDQRLYNDVLGVLSTMQVGWRRDSVDSTGVNFVRKLSRCLWYIDPHHEKLRKQGISIPDRFSCFTGYNDYKKKKTKEPRLSSEELDHHIQELSGVLMQPWFSLSRFQALRTDLESFVDSMLKYKEYLLSHKEKVQSRQEETVMSDREENASLITIPGSGCSSTSPYVSLEDRLANSQLYEPLFLNDIAPVDRLERRKWLSKLKLPFAIMMYKFAYGNHLGTLIYVWKIPEDQPVDQSIVSRNFSRLTEQQSHYCTRAMRREFLDKYRRLAKVPTMVLRNIFRTLLQDSSCAEHSSEALVDERVAKAIIDVDDPDIVLDLRRCNGKPKTSLFDTFWQEVQLFLDEISLAVDERRHGDTLHMPFAVSIRHLQEMIIERLKQKYPDSTPAVPSLEWIRLQFWPSNAYTDRAIRYTGRFNVKFGVQIRQLRKDHPDKHYVNALLQYVRGFSVKFREFLLLASVDDKAIVPVGEPNCPVSTGVRGHHRSLVCSGAPLVALDHDFHVHGIVPSVAFFVNIPDSSSDSFFNGDPFVTNKDKVSQPSSAIRHSTEMTKIIRTHYSEGGSVSTKPVLVIVSDGGPDHRVTFGSVQVSSIALFMALNLDMLICVRTCPYQSWTNIAERIMSTLNLALQNVSLARTGMAHRFEELLKNKNTLADVRKVLAECPELALALQDSMQAPLVALNSRFEAMKVKGNQVRNGVPASDSDISEQFEHVLSVDPSLQMDKLTAKDLGRAKSLQQFMEKHCHKSAYVFQIKKCTEPLCKYCSEHPVRLSHEKFSALSFLPLPLLDASKEHYQKFEDVLGKPISSIDQPSRVAAPTEEQKEVDKKRKGLLVAGKVRTMIECGECFKPRCVYANAKLTREEEVQLESVKETKVYTCGSSLGSETIVVREALVCSTPVEAQYYSSVLIHFPPVCYHCGIGEEALVDDEELRELKKAYATVYPLCFLCKSDGKKPICKRPSNVAKKQRLS